MTEPIKLKFTMNYIHFDDWIFKKIENHLFNCTFIPDDIVWSKNNIGIDIVKDEIFYSNITHRQIYDRLDYGNIFDFMNETKIIFARKVYQFHNAYKWNPPLDKINVPAIIIELYPTIKRFIMDYLLLKIKFGNEDYPIHFAFDENRDLEYENDNVLDSIENRKVEKKEINKIFQKFDFITEKEAKNDVLFKPYEVLDLKYHKSIFYLIAYIHQNKCYCEYNDQIDYLSFYDKFLNPMLKASRIIGIKVGVQRDYLDSEAKFVDLVIFTFYNTKYFFIEEDKVNLDLFLNALNLMIRNLTSRRFVKFSYENYNYILFIKPEPYFEFLQENSYNLRDITGFDGNI